MKRKFGKCSDGMLDYQDYLVNNIDDHINNERKYENRYRESKNRANCIVCNTKIPNSDFVRNSIRFSFCTNCGHLNGHNILQDSLANEIYTDQSESEIKYDKYYIQEKTEFDSAVKNIYEPKAEFLADSLKEFLGITNFKRMKILDFGTGSGHMVKALGNVGFIDVSGIDPMSSTIEFGEKVMEIKNLKRVPAKDSLDYLQSTDAQIVCMICTLPHVADPHAVLLAMKKNPKIKYTYQKLPMFSLGAIFDIAHPEINSRVISGTHTHIYTEESLKFMENEFQLERVSEWRFGADILDLYRNLQVSLMRNKASANLSVKFAETFIPIIDSLQLLVDKHNFASEIHVLWKFKK
jgi:2-polyprenyl-3-methyl-5-hydroxy-6-metoxy-1,4-benzoquinol methylase